MTVTNPVSVCNIRGYQTEHPKLIIVPKENSMTLFRVKPIIPTNIDMFAYVNSKFVYTERHIRTQMENLYQHLIKQKCELERDVLVMQLSIASYAPQEFAYLRMKEPGYTATLLGEVINIMKCQPVEVTIRKTDRCYNELPITYLNKTSFMSPKSHLIQFKATEIVCSSIVSSQYQLMNSWYGFSPDIHVVPHPAVLAPIQANKWEYMEPGSLANGGIYSSEDLEQFRNMFMFHSERSAISNVLALTVSGMSNDKQSLHMENLLNDSIIENVISAYWKRAWGWFSRIGEITSGLVGIYFVSRIIKFLLDTAIHAWALYPLYGMSWRLVGMFWDTLTFCLVHQANAANNDNPPDVQNVREPIEEEVVVVVEPNVVQNERKIPLLYPQLVASS